MAKADSDLYRNGYIPRAVLRRIAVEQLDFTKRRLNRYSHRSSVVAAVALPADKVTAVKVTAAQLGGTAAITVTAMSRPSTASDSIKSIRSEEQINGDIESAQIENLLDCCQMGSQELFRTLSWAGEFERRRLSYGDPKGTDLTARVLNWTKAQSATAVKSCEGVLLLAHKGAQLTDLKHTERNPISALQAAPSTPISFYSTEKFCTLLLKMINAKTDRNCQIDRLAVYGASGVKDDLRGGF